MWKIADSISSRIQSNIINMIASVLWLAWRRKWSSVWRRKDEDLLVRHLFQHDGLIENRRLHLMVSSSVLWFYGNTYSQSRNLTQHDSQVQSRLHLHLAVLKKNHFKYLICEKLNLFGWLHTSTRYSPEEQRVYRCST
jgi:hypothetical protein